MQLTGLLEKLTATETFSWVVSQLQSEAPLASQALLRSARPFVVAGLSNALQRPILIVTAKPNRAYDVAEQLPVWMPDAQVVRFQEPTSLFYERAPWTTTVLRSRIQTLATLAPPIVHQTRTHDNRPLVVVTSAHALMQKTLPVKDFRVGSREYRAGQLLDSLDKTLEHWVGIGYQPASVVVEAGTFSRRGGIIDVFPMAADLPYRLELFGEEIESIRQFEPTTQRSHQTVPAFVVTPAREVLPKHLSQAMTRLRDWFTTQAMPEDDPTSAQNDIANLENGTAFANAEYYLPYAYPQAASLLDYLPDNTLVVVEDWRVFEDTIAELEEQALEQRDYHHEKGTLPAFDTLPYHTWDEIRDNLQERTPLHLGSDAENIDSADIVLGDLFQPGQHYGGQARAFLDHLLANPAEDKVLVVTRQAERFVDLWAEGHAALPKIENVSSMDALGRVNFIDGELSEGFILQEEKNAALHLLTDAEIFGWHRPEPRRRRQPRPQSPEVFFADLAEGDAVVHVDYGVGRFKGIIKRQFEANEREFLQIEYAGNDTLYVPIHQADRLSRYVGVDDKSPKLNRLGTSDWAETKKRANAAAQEIAEELLQLYASRAIVPGYAFSPDTPWQHELEASFPYVETDDQLRALREVKRDMEQPRPMDRLVCGDVGYGKTEVALRAAFKAVMDGKQVAILVPTTILAQQHFNTFNQRLVAFPMKVDMLSRFRTKLEQEQTLYDLAQGQVDILIGTHRLLQNDVYFKNLGLLVIDEEQRFGVTHKEALKRLRTEVDVLTLTATPIPRTLYMALTGVRDISLIQTPPEERLPVVTHVGYTDEKLIRQAILRELERGGQVFFLHNRVRTIETTLQRLRRLVPEASFVIGHGQMEEDKLEKVMVSFAAGESDVLICTTIIENGVDIPNANTMIIDHADQFGLSQLYQLRGRVGRGAHQAYAYFMYSPTSRLTEEAYARLDTINEYTDLGVGLSIAMRDLEIRGMGDMLGSRQSGHIEAIGFHLYTQLLAQAVQQSKGAPAKTLSELLPPDQTVNTSFSVTIDLPMPAYLPTDYIPEMNLRLQLYRRLANVQNEVDLDAMVAELQDRFGELPRAVQGIIFQLRIKLLAQKSNATSIGHEAGKIFIKLPYLGGSDRQRIQDYLGDDVKVSRTALWFGQLEDGKWQPLLIETLRRLDVERISVAL